jgi:hypothetical protein
MSTEELRAVCSTVQTVTFVVTVGAVVAWIAWLVNRPAGECGFGHEEEDEL